MIRVQVLEVKQRHGRAEAERTSDWGRVTAEGKNVSDLSKTQKAKAYGYYTVK